MTTVTAFQRITDQLTKLGPVRRAGANRLTALCPAHDDKSPSLSITGIPGSVLIYCHAGCPTTDVLDALGLASSDLFDDPRGSQYRYPDGRIVHRTPAKKFRQSGNTSGRSLFHAELIPDAVAAGRPVYVVEGEKDVLALEAVGAAATCSPMGAGKWSSIDPTPLHGAQVVIVADRDAPGRKHAHQIAESLTGHAEFVIVEAATGKDAADHIAAGRGVDEFTPVEWVTRPEPDTLRPRAWKASDLNPAGPIRWLATGRIPAGALTYMVGHEGIGKSLFLVWLTAIITTGRAFPAFGIRGSEPQTVVLVLTEDDWATIARPRLDVAGADLDRVVVICAERDGSGSPTFPDHMDVVAGAASGAALVIVDAWADTLPGTLSVKDPQQARQALHPWKELATRTGVAVLLAGHTNREKAGNVRNAYGLTAELRKKARMTLLAQADPDDDRVLLLGPEKSNLTAPIPASRFRITSEQAFAPTPDSDGTVPRLEWAGDAEQSAGALYAEAAAAERDDDTSDRTETEQWLEDYLTENGPSPRKSVLAAAAKEKFAERTVKRAAANLAVVSEISGFPRTATWSLPSRATSGPMSVERGPTGPTGRDLHKPGGPTEPDRQLGHGPTDGPTGPATPPSGPPWAPLSSPPPTEPPATARRCGHPGDPSARCGTCIAERANRRPVCRVCDRPADPANPAGLCDRLDADHHMGWRTAQTGQPWPGDAA